MELVEGTTLRRLIDEHGRLPVHDAVDIAQQVADALDAAHRSGPRAPRHEARERARARRTDR